MKWENRDINVEEWANIPNLVTPLRVSNYSLWRISWYGFCEKAGINFEISNEKHF